MSRTFFYGFNKIISKINISKFSSENNIINSIAVVSILSGHAAYSYMTKKETNIVVNNTYIYTNNGYTEFMVVDTLGNHYSVNNSLWYWKWNSIEDWHSIKEEQKLDTLIYGWRMPILGMFPNIVSCRYNKSKNTTVKDTPLIEDLSGL